MSKLSRPLKEKVSVGCYRGDFPPVPAFLILRSTDILFGHDLKNYIIKSLLFNLIYSGKEQRKGLDSVSNIVAPMVVIGSLIVGLLLILVVYRRRSQREYPLMSFWVLT